MRAFLLLLFSGIPVGAMIFADAADPAANKQTAPTGAYENAGWQFELRYKDYLGTMISPKHFVTATHLGQGGLPNQPMFFNGVEDKTFTLKNAGLQVGIPGTDFSIFEIWETFESYAPLYQGGDETGKEVFICGRGLGRGSALTKGNETVGWKWGNNTTYADRWGVNVITASQLRNGNDFIYTTFDPDGVTHECALTGNDSGGGWFIKEGGIWKLAAVSSTVDATRDTNDTTGDNSHFRASMTNARGYYLGSDSQGWFFIPENPDLYTNPLEYYTDRNDARHYERTHSYGSRISSHLLEFNAIIQPAINHAALDGNGRFQAWLADAGITTLNGPRDDPDGDGHSNLLEYFSNSNPSMDTPSPFGVERLGGGEIQFTLTQSLDLAGRGLTGTIQESEDLTTWTPLTGLHEQSSVINATAGQRTRVLELATPALEKRFYRLKISLTN